MNVSFCRAYDDARKTPSSVCKADGDSRAERASKAKQYHARRVVRSTEKSQSFNLCRGKGGRRQKRVKGVGWLSLPRLRVRGSKLSAAHLGLDRSTSQSLDFMFRLSCAHIEISRRRDR